ncbi:MAG: SHOCT domain-containing protein [Coriobacteriia bacterium]|nr:SHOCT domain-containing protein [Coriobacteriia bacterium]
MMGRGYGYGDSMMGGYGWFETLIMFFFGALVIAGIVLLVIWAVRASTHHPSASGGASPPPGAAGHDEAVAIAKRRLASGEINKDQYDEIMRALGG